MSTLPRRRFLALSATAFAAGALDPLQASVPAQTSGSAALPRTLVLYREGHALSGEFAMLGRQAGLTPQVLTDDPVRQWRDGLGTLVGQQGWHLAGIGNWIDFILIRGLAAEARRLPLLVLQHSEAQLQQSGINATAAALLDFLQGIRVAQVSPSSNAENLVRKDALLIGRSLNTNNRPDLFSWVI